MAAVLVRAAGNVNARALPYRVRPRRARLDGLTRSEPGCLLRPTRDRASSVTGRAGRVGCARPLARIGSRRRPLRGHACRGRRVDARPVQPVRRAPVVDRHRFVRAPQLLISNSGDGLVRNLAFFCVLSPSGEALSLDRLLKTREHFWEFPRVPRGLCGSSNYRSASGILQPSGINPTTHCGGRDRGLLLPSHPRH